MATAQDEPLLYALFAATKIAEFAAWGLTSQQLEPLLAMQFRARQLGYAQTYPAAVDMVLCRADGTSVGRHLMERQPDGYRSIDLAILPEFQNQGIGTWALHQMQQLAAAEDVSFHLHVLRSNPALRLYERLGFVRAAGDEVSYEMEWTAREPMYKAAEPLAGAQDRELCDIAPQDGSGVSRQDFLHRTFSFLREIGLEIHLDPVPSSTFLPGIQLVGNGLRVDLEALRFPGDVLHEAGHLAVMTPDRRGAEFPVPEGAAEEMAAMAWSYAACTHLGLPPEVVFHPSGYRGQASALIAEFEAGKCIGLPYLWWIGLTTQTLPEQPSIYPRMLRWMRGGPEFASATPEDSGYCGSHELESSTLHRYIAPPLPTLPNHAS